MFSNMAFRVLLKTLDDRLGSEDCHKLKFLAADVGIPKAKLDRVRQAIDIFDELEKQVLIAPEDVGLVWELMELIYRKDLVKIIDSYCIKNYIKEKKHGNVSISNYRLLLLKVADNTSSAEFNCFKQGCKDILSRQAVSKLEDVYQLFSLLEEREILSVGNLSFLQDLLKLVGNIQMMAMIQQFQGQGGPMELELANLSSQLASEWQKLGTYLGLAYSTLQAINFDRRTIEDKAMQMLMTWKQTVPPGVDAYAQLCGALKQCGRMDLASIVDSYAKKRHQLPTPRPLQTGDVRQLTHHQPQYAPNQPTGYTTAQPHLMKPADFWNPPATTSMLTHSGVQEIGSLSQQIDNHGVPDQVLQELSEHIIVEWKKMGTFLNIDYATILQIDKNYYDRSEQKAFTMLMTWRNRVQVGTDAVAELASVLKTIHRVDLSEALKGMLLRSVPLSRQPQDQPPTYDPPPEPMITDTTRQAVKAQPTPGVPVHVASQADLPVSVQEEGPTHADHVPVVIQEAPPEYRMDRNPRGLCMIINNTKFQPNKGFKDRPGSEVDAGKLNNLFNKLHFKVQVFEDHSAKDMYKCFKKVSQLDHSQFDCFVCCIMSHGTLGVVYGSDGEPVQIQDILQLFKSISCSTLKGKPKLFFIQACQGTTYQEGADIQPDERNLSAGMGLNLKKTLPNEADILLSYATVPGYFCSKTSGSWFVQALVDEITKYHDQYDIITILAFVNKRLGNNFATVKNVGPRMQIAAPRFTLRKRLFLPSLTP